MYWVTPCLSVIQNLSFVDVTSYCIIFVKRQLVEYFVWFSCDAKKLCSFTVTFMVCFHHLSVVVLPFFCRLFLHNRM